MTHFLSLPFDLFSQPHVGGSGSGGSSEESRSGRSSRGTITDTGGSSSVDPSSSEQSCDTVIYVGPGGDDATDGEHPPVYLPALNSGDNRCSMNKALRGSAVDAASKVAPEAQRTPKKSSKGGVSSKSPSKSAKHTASGVAAAKDGAHASPHRTKESHKARDGGAGGAAASLPRTPTKYSSPGAKISTGATPKSPKSPHVSRHSRHK
ncbi:putative kinesin-like protein, partial [Penaeus vannamei]